MKYEYAYQHFSPTELIVVHSGKNTCTDSLELGLDEVSHSVSLFRSELLCFSEKSFFPQILFLMTLFFIYKTLSKQVPAGVCDLAEIYQINIFYAVLSSEVNQEVTLIHLTAHCFCQCIVQLQNDYQMVFVM